MSIPTPSATAIETRPRTTPTATRVVRACALAIAVSTLVGCAGVKMQRADGAHKYRALPLGTTVQIVGSEMQLGVRYVVIGNFHWVVSSSKAQPDEEMAKAKLSKKAARFGCDAVAGVASSTEEVKTKKKVRNMGEGGKVTYSFKEESSYKHTYTGRCVRTEKAPGGLIEGTGQTAELKEAAKPPTLDVAPEATAGIASSGSKVGASVEALWDRLSLYKSSYLKNWADALGKPPKDAMMVLEAFSELMVQVSGKTGFWQHTVGTEWFGCPANPKQDQCVKLDAAIQKLAAWERMQAAMARQKEAGASAYIKAHRRRMIQYLEEVVPAQPNLSGMQQTPFYMQHIR